MNEQNLSIYTIDKDSSLVEAMSVIDKNSIGLTFVVDQENHLIGCLTDGDIRRWFLKSGSIEGRVCDAMNPHPKYVRDDERDLALQKMEFEKIYSIAVVNDNGMIIDIILHKSKRLLHDARHGDAIEGTPIIIMAGGKGTRLYPYTKVLPKPLIPIGDVPILERIMKRFYQHGATKFYLSVNYRKEMIKSYFADANLPYEIHYVEESKPLGTAGSIALIKEKFNVPVIVTNCDAILEINYADVIKHHKEMHNKMTIVSSLKNVSVPYGVLNYREKGVITSMKEKPELSFFINTGMYVVDPGCLALIPVDCVFHMTDLADMLIEKGEQVGMYPVSESSFLDMGQLEEMKKMEERIQGSYGRG